MHIVVSCYRIGNASNQDFLMRIPLYIDSRDSFARADTSVAESDELRDGIILDYDKEGHMGHG